MPVLQLARPDDATDAAALAAVTGAIAALERTPLRTVGFTGARHERLDLTLRGGARRALVVKRVRVADDWTARRTGDRLGREAAMLAEPSLADIWTAFACPYVAFAADGEEVALVMDDLTPHLFPDVREPLRREQEERLLSALAALHARFWSAPALDRPWLARPVHYVGLVAPDCAADEASLARMSDALRETILSGWALALAWLPPAVARVLSAPAEELEWLWRGLPRTLLHGDSKVANFALLPDGRAAAFDWALLGAGPATIDVGWFLGVNATRLTRAKDDVLARYRALLEAGLGAPLPDALWAALVRAGIIVGARMLLWSKAAAVEAGRAGARDEWSWWAERLEAACE